MNQSLLSRTTAVRKRQITDHEYQIAILPGDGVGPELMGAALQVLDVLAEKYSFHCTYREGLIGGAAYAREKNHLPPSTLEICRESDAILLGTVGGPRDLRHLPRWKNCARRSRFALRRELGVCANLSRSRVFASLEHASPLKPVRIGAGIDILIVRELLGDIYHGSHSITEQAGARIARDVAEYTDGQIRQVAHIAFKAALARDCRVVSVDKANILDSSKLWRGVVAEVAREYPEVELSHMLVDVCASELVTRPEKFDVILSSNLFAKILASIASSLPGTDMLSSSAGVAPDGVQLFEPLIRPQHELVGLNSVSPTPLLLAVAMMLRHSLGQREAAEALLSAIGRLFERGLAHPSLSWPRSVPFSSDTFILQLMKEIESPSETRHLSTGRTLARVDG